MKVFISGKITGERRYKEKFARAEALMKKLGHTVLNPAILPETGFEHEEYLHICKAMIDVCDAVYVLGDWQDSPGARIEVSHAKRTGVKVLQEQG